ncbi:hypothetical protein PDJ95_27885 [Bacillus cereus]|nr:hypothetical protein [Bacillus cereus]
MRNMNKILTGALTLAMFAGSLPGTALAADNSDPVTKNGERLKYNTPYYLKDKTLPNKGGITVESWLFFDLLLFSNSPTDNGDPIIFKNPDGTGGFIKSGDNLKIKITKFMESGYQYWANDAVGVMLTAYNCPNTHRVYGSSKDNSIGIGSMEPMPESMRYYRGKHADKAWLTGGGSVATDGEQTKYSPVRPDQVEKIETPFELIEVSE